MQIVILGDSHTTALRLGLEMLQKEPGFDPSLDVKGAVLCGSPALIEPFFEVRAGEVLLSNEAAAAVLRKLTGRESFTKLDREKVFALSMGFPPQLLLSYADWNAFAPWAAAAEGKQLLSDAVIGAMARDHFKYVLAFYRALRDLDLAVVAVASPPILAGDQWFAPTLDPEVVLAVASILRRAIADELAGYGVPTVFPPKQVYLQDDPGRHRRPEFPSFKGPHDLGHADGRFGRLMIPRIVAAARGL